MTIYVVMNALTIVPIVIVKVYESTCAKQKLDTVETDQETNFLLDQSVTVSYSSFK